MSTVSGFLRRDPADITPWAETCGQIRPLVEEQDEAAADVHHVEIRDAKLHDHERTDEEIELHRGVVVHVPGGVKHKAVGKLTVLTVCIPGGVLHDVHEVE